MAKDIGCNGFTDPWNLYELGPRVMFDNPQSIATSGKTSNLSPGATTPELQGYFAEFVLRNGWTREAQFQYNTLFSKAYPGVFLPCAFRCGLHVNDSSEIENYNMGQISLNNAMGWVFLDWPNEDIAIVPVNPNNPDDQQVPIFANPITFPKGVKNVQHLLKNEGKYFPMIQLAVSQAKSSTDGGGCCGQVMTFVKNTLDRKIPGWRKSGSLFAEWANTCN